MKIKDLKIEGKMICHMAFDTAHLMKHELTILAPDNLVNGRKFYKETKTKKRKGQYGSFGKSETIYYFDSESQTFETINELLKSIGIDVTEI